MRLLKAVLGLLFLALGLLFGALNRAPVSVEFGFWTVRDATLGIVLLIAVFAGALLAGLVLTVGVIWPLRHRLRHGVAPAGPPIAPVAPVAHD